MDYLTAAHQVLKMNPAPVWDRHREKLSGDLLGQEKMLASALALTPNRSASQLSAAYSMLHDAALTTAIYETNIGMLQDDSSPAPGSLGGVAFSGLTFTDNGKGFKLLYVSVSADLTVEDKALGDDLCDFAMGHVKRGLGVDPDVGGDAADSLFVNPLTGEHENAVTWALRASVSQSLNSASSATSQAPAIADKSKVDVTMLVVDLESEEGFTEFTCSSDLTDPV